MKKQSAGLLVYRQKNAKLEVLIAHMGGPWWAKKDLGAWSIPKGEYFENEDPKEVAKREFHEELGIDPPFSKWLDLGTIEQKNNKIVIAWAAEGDLDVSHIKSNTFKAEWPPKSGQIKEFPEIDRAGWFSIEEAAKKLIPEQVEFLGRLTRELGIEKHFKQNSLF
jgi:predicted NUDIX family NTP pyrophosphohydrolase